MNDIDAWEAMLRESNRARDAVTITVEKDVVIGRVSCWDCDAKYEAASWKRDLVQASPSLRRYVANQLQTHRLFNHGGRP